MNRHHDIDEDFVREVLRELRDGEQVTVRVKRPAAFEQVMLRLGATEEELERVTVLIG